MAIFQKKYQITHIYLRNLSRIYQRSNEEFAMQHACSAQKFGGCKVKGVCLVPIVIWLYLGFFSWFNVICCANMCLEILSLKNLGWFLMLYSCKMSRTTIVKSSCLGFYGVVKCWGLSVVVAKQVKTTWEGSLLFLGMSPMGCCLVRHIFLVVSLKEHCYVSYPNWSRPCSIQHGNWFLTIIVLN